MEEGVVEFPDNDEGEYVEYEDDTIGSGAETPPRTDYGSKGSRPLSPPHAAPDPSSSSAAGGGIALEVARLLLQGQITATVGRFSDHLGLLFDLYSSGLRAREVLLDASHARAAPLIPFQPGEEPTAAARVDRMLLAFTRGAESEMAAFRKQCAEARASWQERFLSICTAAAAAEKARQDDYLIELAVCRREVQSTVGRMKAAFATKSVAVEESRDMAATVETLGREASQLRDALSAARRQAEADRERHFADQEALAASCAATLQQERRRLADRLREVEATLEGERSHHFEEMTTVSRRHAQAIADIEAELSSAREATHYGTSEASSARGELMAAKRAAAEERAVLTRYLMDLEAALVESGGRPEALASQRMAHALIEQGRTGGAGKAAIGADAPMALSTSRSVTGLAAISAVDHMLAARGAGAGGGTPSGGGLASPYSSSASWAARDVAQGTFLSQLRSPSASASGPGAGHRSSRSHSPNYAASPMTPRGGAGAAAGAPFRPAAFGARSMASAERDRTLRNQGGTLAVGSPMTPSSIRRW